MAVKRVFMPWLLRSGATGLVQPRTIYRCLQIWLMILTATFGVALTSCGSPKELPAPPDAEWQALLKSQEEEIHRLEAEVTQLRANCRSSATWAPEATAPPPSLEALSRAEPLPQAARPQPRPDQVSRAVPSREVQERAAAIVANILGSSAPSNPSYSPPAAVGRLVTLREPEVSYGQPGELAVEGKIWNPSYNQAVSRTATLQLLVSGRLIDQRTLYFEDIPPQGEQVFSESFRYKFADDVGAVYSARLVYE